MSCALRPIESLNNLTFETRKTVLSKQVFVIQRGKREYEHFLWPVNHLNQRKSPSAPLVSKEKRTILNRVFSTKFVVFLEVTEVTKVTEVGGDWGSMGNRASRKSNKLVEQINCIKERLEELEQELKGKNDWKERFEKEQREQLEILQKGRLYGDHYWIERLA